MTKPSNLIAISFPFLVLQFAFLVSCSGRNALTPVNKYRLDQTAATECLRWGTRFRLGIFSGREYSTANGFIKSFAQYAESVPFPVVIWAADGKRNALGYEVPDHQTYEEVFKGMSPWAGPYLTKLRPGFVEIAWANVQDEKKIRDLMSRQVPPILFQSRNAADFLKMWHDVSGMEFRYDPELIEESRKYDRARLIEESDPDLFLAQIPERPFPLGFTKFVSTETLDIASFMHKLAAHVGGLARKTLSGWVIEKFRRNDEGLQLIEDCISQMKSDPWFSSPEAIEILSRIGAPALPELLREFRPIRIDQDIRKQFKNGWKMERIDEVFEGRLLAVLSQIPSPERDKALLAALQNGISGLPDYPIEILAASNCQAAIPIIKQIANDPVRIGSTRLTANIALNALGQPQTSPEQEEPLIAIDPSIRKLLENEKGSQVIELLRAVLYQCRTSSTGSQIHSVNTDSSNSMILDGTYPLSSSTKPHGYWTFEVPVLRSDRAMIRYSFVCGKLCSEGWLGKLTKLNGRWLVTRWRQLWLS
jgi:hypothetical protein